MNHVALDQNLLSYNSDQVSFLFRRLFQQRGSGVFTTMLQGHLKKVLLTWEQRLPIGLFSQITGGSSDPGRWLHGGPLSLIVCCIPSAIPQHAMSIQGWGFVDMWEGENFWVAVPGVGYGNRQVACVAELGHHNVSFPGCFVAYSASTHSQS